jgi:hypothetical protein
MTTPTYDRFCAEIVTQTRRLRDGIDDADMTAPVRPAPAGTSANWYATSTRATAGQRSWWSCAQQGRRRM